MKESNLKTIESLLRSILKILESNSADNSDTDAK